MTTQSPAPADNPVPPSSPPSWWEAFFLGSAAFVSVLMAFWLRHTDEIVAYVERLGWWSAVSVVFLLCLVIAGALLVTTQKPRTRLKAFMLGLSAPAVIFAADIGGIGSDPTVKAPTEMGLLPDRVTDALMLVLSPLSVVDGIQKERAQGVVDELGQDVIAARRESRDAESKLAVAESSLQSSRASVNDLEQSLTTAQGRERAALAKVGDLETSLEERTDELLAANTRAADLSTELQAATDRAESIASRSQAELRQVQGVVAQLERERDALIERIEAIDPIGRAHTVSERPPVSAGRNTLAFSGAHVITIRWESSTHALVVDTTAMISAPTLLMGRLEVRSAPRDMRSLTMASGTTITLTSRSSSERLQFSVRDRSGDQSACPVEELTASGSTSIGSREIGTGTVSWR